MQRWYWFWDNSNGALAGKPVMEGKGRYSLKEIRRVDVVGCIELMGSTPDSYWRRRAKTDDS